MTSVTERGPALSFDRVTKAYGATPALDDFSLSVERGELFALVGGNGAGKTTLIKCLLDFTAADRGDIAIFGAPNGLTASRADLAFLPERFNPPHYLTGRDFLRYMSELHRKPYEEDLVRQTFERLDLDISALTRPARTYSKGMTQKLGLAACLLSRKNLQVLDEPTSGLNPKARALLKRELRGLRDAGRTVFFTSHSLADVQEICDRMAVVHDGHLMFAGRPDELISKFRSRNLEQAFLACIGEVIAA
ncbi:MAG TPA: ABC transporter ATP-binding protein [Burkholderiales bacterium]|nr:ABC transporter ATP-binding protein [Burkholderiales bacterium]